MMELLGLLGCVEYIREEGGLASEGCGEVTYYLINGFTINKLNK